MKTKLLLLFLFVFTLNNNSKASHLSGGEIYWRCNSNGDFVFYMNIYRECSGQNWNFSSPLIIDIAGASLPLSSNNQTINQISLSPDSVKWLNNNFGDLAIKCNPGGSFSCAYGAGTQAFYYESAPIQLKGTPPPTGWKFYYFPPGARASMENIVSGGVVQLLLRAHMYSDINNNSTNICNDNSPVFVEPAAYLFCRNFDFESSSYAYDGDLGDSISYQLASPIGPPILSPVPATFNQGFSANNPTPDQLIDGRNVGFTINNKTGECKMKIVSGAGSQKYAIVIQVDSWRQGKRVSSIFREMPYTIFNCSNPTTGPFNYRPNLSINSTLSNSYTLNVFAGQYVFIPIQASDMDLNLNQQAQEVTIVPRGSQFANNFSSTTNCNLPPCATLANSAPSYDSNDYRYKIKGVSNVSSLLIWQTDSNHLGPNFAMKSYHFDFYVTDDYCGPAAGYGEIEVNVFPNTVSIYETSRKKEELMVFPNPTNGQFFIQSNENHTYIIRIRNLQGQVVSIKQYENTNQIMVDLNEKTGIYILEVENELGERFQEKIVKY